MDFDWLGFHQVALIHHQPNWTLVLEKCLCQFDLLVLESEFHLLWVKKTRKKMMGNDSCLKGVLEVHEDPEDELVNSDLEPNVV